MDSHEKFAEVYSISNLDLIAGDRVDQRAL